MSVSASIKKHEQEEFYIFCGNGDEKLKTLLRFLKNEVIYEADYVKKEILNEDFYSGNSHAVEREDGKIKVFSLCDDDEEYVLYMNYDNFIEILDTWKKLYEQRVDEMVLTMDENYHCTLKAK